MYIKVTQYINRLKHGTIIRTGITYKKIPYKSLLNSHGLEVERNSL